MNRIEWNQFVLEHGPRSGRFLQSWEWGEFQRAVGERVRREEFSERGIRVGVAQWLDRRVMDFVRYAYCPKGPVLRSGLEWSEGLKGPKGTMFLRIEPDQSSLLQLCEKSINCETKRENNNVRSDIIVSSDAKRTRVYTPRLAAEKDASDLSLVAPLGAQGEASTLSAACRAVHTIDLSPAHTRITDLSAAEDQLLAAMHPKTRYNIRVAQKHEVVVDLAQTDFDAVRHLFKETSSRGTFRLHSKEYYSQMVESLKDGACHAFLATASHDDKLLAANIIIDFGDTRTYLHGASSNEHRNLMGPYLLHWELLRDAKARGMNWYDWWGVVPPSDPPPFQGSFDSELTVEEGARGGCRVRWTRGGGSAVHPWAGISRFKRGFPGIEYASPGTYDMILRPFRYRLYQLARRIRRTV